MLTINGRPAASVRAEGVRVQYLHGAVHGKPRRHRLGVCRCMLSGCGVSSHIDPGGLKDLEGSLHDRRVMRWVGR